MNAYIILSNGVERELTNVTGMICKPEEIIIATAEHKIPYKRADIIRIELVNAN